MIPGTLQVKQSSSSFLGQHQFLSSCRNALRMDQAKSGHWQATENLDIDVPATNAEAVISAMVGPGVLTYSAPAAYAQRGGNVRRDNFVFASGASLSTCCPALHPRALTLLLVIMKTYACTIMRFGMQRRCRKLQSIRCTACTVGQSPAPQARLVAKEHKE